uniref:Uncharacterized protein n=1 Tax=Arundo donax TaxID=35708 RepID=A0A0A9BYJ2_ARUDO
MEEKLQCHFRQHLSEILAALFCCERKGGEQNLAAGSFPQSLHL